MWIVFPVLPLPVLALLAWPALAQTPEEPPLHAGSAPSRYEVRRAGEDAYAFTVRNLRYETFGAFDGERSSPRLLTVVTDTTVRTDSEGTEGRVSVTLDDLSGPQPRHLATFEDPGSEGTRFGDRHFVTVQYGCCAAPNLFRLRFLPTGAPLYRATGPVPTGTSAFLEAPNARAALRRWAAFDAGLEPPAPGTLGILAYGGDGGPVQRLRLRLEGVTEEAFDEAFLGLAHGGTLAWVQPGQEPGSGRPSWPVQIWVLNGGRPAAAIGGFALRLSDGDGRPVAEIPVLADRLVPEGATLAPGYALLPEPLTAP
ncbi:hypothetical protein ACE7GA_07875 [Roseomonas sp. CCTCC AB2023176]|uniref:hypothetical protein n=1 Tax=Roseomonas sp. CCTCC AB2023176 TaxID=3342640 RepID=UPI0035D94C22